MIYIHVIFFHIELFTLKYILRLYLESRWIYIHTYIHTYIHRFHTFIHTFINSYIYIYIYIIYKYMDGIPLHFLRFPHGFGGIPPLKNPPSLARPVPPWAPQKGDFFDGSETATVGLLRCPRDVSTREMVGNLRKTHKYIYIYSNYIYQYEMDWNGAVSLFDQRFLMGY